jgi:hypothetical protein
VNTRVTMFGVGRLVVETLSAHRVLSGVGNTWTNEGRPVFGESLQCAQSPRVLIVKSGDFPVEFHEGDGLKNRRLGQCKMWIRQVLISRTLTDCGEVAERLKAAVC